MNYYASDEQRTRLIAGLRDLADVITATQLSLPGDMQPLWGPDERRVMP